MYMRVGFIAAFFWAYLGCTKTVVNPTVYQKDSISVTKIDTLKDTVTISENTLSITGSVVYDSVDGYFICSAVLQHAAPVGSSARWQLNLSGSDDQGVSFLTEGQWPNTGNNLAFTSVTYGQTTGVGANAIWVSSTAKSSEFTFIVFDSKNNVIGSWTGYDAN